MQRQQQFARIYLFSVQKSCRHDQKDRTMCDESDETIESATGVMKKKNDV